MQYGLGGYLMRCRDRVRERGRFGGDVWDSGTQGRIWINERVIQASPVEGGELP